MLARWYLLLEQFSVTFEYRPVALHANADGMSRQCGQCQRPDCPVSASDSQVADRDVPQVLKKQPSDMGPWTAGIVGGNLGGFHAVGRSDGGFTPGGCRFGPYRGLPPGQDVGDGSGMGPVGQCAVVV